jgi:hypothetical protein
MTLKELLYAVLSALLPLVYTAITGKAPEFGNILDPATFIALALWLVGLPFGGWQLLKGRLLYKAGKTGSAKLGNYEVK